MVIFFNYFVFPDLSGFGVPAIPTSVPYQSPTALANPNLTALQHTLSSLYADINIFHGIM